MDTDDLKRARRERDTALRVAQEALRQLDDDQLAQVRKRLDEGDDNDGSSEPDALRAGSGDQ